MAVFGVQLVVSMIMASVLSKLSTHFSFASCVFGRSLTYFLCPTDNQLKALSGRSSRAFTKANSRNRGKQQKDNEKEDNGFLVSKNIDIELDHASVTVRDLYSMHYYSELQWIVDFAFISGLVYCITEVYLAYFARAHTNEFNLSILWLLMTITFCMKYLFKVTVVYAAGPNGRWIVCFTIALVFLVLAMAVLVVDERLLNFDLSDSYSNFSAAANAHLDKQNIETSGPASILFYRSVIALIAAAVGGTVAFPGFRLAKTHNDAMATCTSPVVSDDITREFVYAKCFIWLKTALLFKFTFFNDVRLTLYLNQALPFAICLLWIQPLNDQIIRNLPLEGDNACKQNMFYTWRLILILCFCAFRIALIKYHLQAHLNSARDIVDAMKGEAGKIRSLELQKIVSRVYYYLCVVAVQYLAPAIILICMTLIWKTMSGYQWSDAIVGNARPVSVTNATTARSTSTSSDNIDAYALAKLSEIFSPKLFRSVFSFSTWWMTLAWSANTGFGLVYYAFFNKAL